MKSEHRHELKTNELGQLAQRLLPFLEKHANRILIGFSVIALIAAAYIYWTRSSSVTANSGWTRIISANTAEEFENIAEVYAGSTIGAWARLSAAEGHLRNGIRAAFKDREAAARLEGAVCWLGETNSSRNKANCPGYAPSKLLHACCSDIRKCQCYQITGKLLTI